MNIPKEEHTYPEWDYKERDYTKEAGIEVREFDKRDESVLREFENDFGAMSKIRSRGLEKTKTHTERRQREKRTKRGKLNPKYGEEEIIRAHSGRNLTQRVFDRKSSREKEERKRASIGLLVDQSGSTRFDTDDGYSRIKLMKYAAINLGRGLNVVDDDFFAYSFHTHESADPTILEELKTPNEEWTEETEKKIAGLESTESTDYFNNKDGAAVRFINSQLSDDPLGKKYVFLVTDGFPYVQNTYYKGKFAYEDTKKALEEGSREGIEYFYLTIAPEDRKDYEKNQDADDFLPNISNITVFSKRFSSESQLVEGLTLLYERIKKGRFN